MKINIIITLCVLIILGLSCLPFFYNRDCKLYFKPVNDVCVWSLK